MNRTITIPEHSFSSLKRGDLTALVTTKKLFPGDTVSVTGESTADFQQNWPEELRDCVLVLITMRHKVGGEFMYSFRRVDEMPQVFFKLLRRITAERDELREQCEGLKATCLQLLEENQPAQAAQGAA